MVRGPAAERRYVPSHPVTGNPQLHPRESRDADARPSTLATASGQLQPTSLANTPLQERGHDQGAGSPASDGPRAGGNVLYHNVEHTFLVILVGRDILHGRILTECLEPDDYSHLIVACLLHNIGYIRGILKGDGMGWFVVDGSGATCSSLSSSFAAKCTPWHEAGCHERTTGISLGEPA